MVTTFKEKNKLQDGTFNMTGLVLTITGFVLNMTRFVPPMTGFVLNMTGLVLKITVFLLNIAGLVLNMIGSKDANDYESNGMAYMTVYGLSLVLMKRGGMDMDMVFRGPR